jgi:uncharacterized membrane protein
MYNVIWVLLGITAVVTIVLSYLDSARVFVG